MDDQTRYRVTGSLFLLAVAVILFPMLFDGAGLPPVEIEPLVVVEDTPVVARLEDVAPATDLLARAEELDRQVDEEGYLADGGTRFGDPVLSKPLESTRAWAVQVASFEEADNALNLREQLRGDGLEAFISTVKTEDGILSRVAVGPLLSFDDADAMQSELAEALKLDVKIVAFSN